MIKVRTPLGYNPSISEQETNNEPSQTIPDLSYTIRELLEKFAHGVMPPVGRDVVYDEDPDIDNPDPTRDPAFDLSDATRLKEESLEILQKQEDEQASKTKEANKKQAIKEAKELLQLESEAKEKEEPKPLPEPE
mgnify:CR=1 FL=1